jgi:hypothetical protein
MTKSSDRAAGCANAPQPLLQRGIRREWRWRQAASCSPSRRDRAAEIERRMEELNAKVWQLERRPAEARMRNQSAILKRLEKIENAIQGMTNPRQVIRVIGDEPIGKHAVGALPQSGLVGSKNTRKSKALQSLKKASVAGFSFEKINSVTIRVDRPGKRAVGWLMEVAWPGENGQRWIARVGDRASKPLPLEEAKKAVRELLQYRGKAGSKDWIAELDKIAAREVDRAVTQREQRERRRKWPLDLMGGRKQPNSVKIERDLRRNILEAECTFPADDDLVPSLSDVA